MKNLRTSLCLCLIVFLLPLTPDADLTKKVIFIHPDNRNELWTTNLAGIVNPHLFFEHERSIYNLSAQIDGSTVAIIARPDEKTTINDAFLANSPAEAINLTLGRFGTVRDIDISRNGDLIFTQLPTQLPVLGPQFQLVLPQRGLFLIPKNELKKPEPKATLLKLIVARSAVWSPNGEQIAYTAQGVFLLDTKTKKDLRISEKGFYPTFSPDGKMLAYLYVTAGKRDIRIVSLKTLRTVNTLENIMPVLQISELKWSPDGKYIIYTAYEGSFFRKETIYHNMAISIDGGPPERLFGMFENGVPVFDWLDASFAVEPHNRLATLWGKLKQ